MSLYKRKGSKNWYVRSGRNIDQSTGTADLDEARLIEAELCSVVTRSKHVLRMDSVGEERAQALTEYTVQMLRKCARRHPYTLTEADEQALMRQAAHGRCSVTGMPFSLHKPAGVRRRPYAPSADRIDASRPYEPGNVRLVCVCVNYALNEWGAKVLRQMALGYLQTQFIPWAAGIGDE